MTMKPQPRQNHSNPQQNDRTQGRERHRKKQGRRSLDNSRAKHTQNIESEENTAKITGDKIIAQTHAHTHTHTLRKTTPDTKAQKAIGSLSHDKTAASHR